MILSQTSEYAIRAVVYIALKGEEGAVRAKDISTSINVPSHYLSKILRRLVEAEVLTGTKGHRGGFFLARPSKKIRLIEVLEAVEVAVPAKHCIFGWRMCNSREPCVLHHRWSSVNDAFQRWARTTTLADIQTDAGHSRWLMSLEDPSLKRRE